jgi:hypothetical protein
MKISQLKSLIKESIREVIAESNSQREGMFKEDAYAQSILDILEKGDIESLNRMQGDPKLVQILIQMLENKPELKAKLEDIALNMSEGISKIVKNSLLALLLTSLLASCSVSHSTKRNHTKQGHCGYNRHQQYNRR